MAYVEHIEGFHKVMKNLQSQLSNLKINSTKGLKEVAIFLRRETETKPLVTPVDLGNLRASWFAIVTGDKGRIADPLRQSGNFREGTKEHPRVKGISKRLGELYNKSISEYTAEANAVKNKLKLICGYSAYYAAAVHEMIEAKNWSRPMSGPKWFQAAINRNINKIVSILAKEAKIKGGGS